MARDSVGILPTKDLPGERGHCPVRRKMGDSRATDLSLKYMVHKLSPKHLAHASFAKRATLLKNAFSAIS